MKSSSDYGYFMAEGQVQNVTESENNQDRLFRVYADIGEVILLILTCGAAKLLGKRIEAFAEAGWLPGKGDARMIAAMTNRPESGVASVIGDKPRQKYHVGRQPFYKLSDFALPNDQSEIVPNDAPVKRAKKK